jgi:hypothetical protein
MRILLAAILVSLTASAAAADPRPPIDTARMASDDCARARKAKKECVLNFDAHEVGGETPHSTGTTVTILKPTPQPSLIRLRRDFIQEILKSAEDE